MTTAIHQLLPAYVRGDAISGAARVTQRLLRSMGLTSELFADYIDPALAAGARPAAALPGAVGSADIVFYHLSIGSATAGVFERCGARQVVVYHNITPPEYYERVSSRVTFWLRRGREDLARLAPRAEFVIADSTFNLSEALAAGARDGMVIPPPVDLARLAPRPATPAGAPELLFVGRYAPNKRHEDLLRILAASRRLLPECRLVLRGNRSDTDVYVATLRDFAWRIGVADAVDFGPDRVTDSEIADAYSRAAVFVCASQHEGFCIPLLEAMAFGVPIVALAAGAVAETAGNAAVILDTADPLVWAEAIASVVHDTTLRTSLIDAGRRRLTDFDERNIARRLADVVQRLGLHVGTAA